MAIGPRDTTSLVMLSGWDATELQNFTLLDGTTYATIVGQMNAALGALAAETTGDSLWASLVSYQNNPELEYRVGISNGFDAHTEYGRPDAKRADTEGHMLPLLAFDRGLGWTWDYLRNARMAQIEADIADAIKDARDKWRVQLLTRLLQRGDDSGTNKGLGSSGESPGFATDAGSTAVDFVPPAYGGTTFTSAHEHYIGIAGGVATLASFQDAKEEIREHGHEPPYDFIIGTSDEVATRALTGFVATDNAYVEYGALQDRVTFQNAAINASGTYPIGALEDFRIWVVRGMPQYYGFGWKSYGANSQRNPVRIRLHKNAPSFAVTAMTDPTAGNATTPIQYLMLFMEFGVGIGDRTNGTSRYWNNATWADGTPT